MIIAVQVNIPLSLLSSQGRISFGWFGGSPRFREGTPGFRQHSQRPGSVDSSRSVVGIREEFSLIQRRINSENVN